MTDVPQDETALAFSRAFPLGLDAVSQEMIARSRKNSAVFLRAKNEMTGVALAEAMGVSESVLSRLVSGGALAAVMLALAGAGLKVVPQDALVFLQQDEFK